MVAADVTREAVKDFFSSTVENALGPHMVANGFLLEEVSEHCVTYLRSQMIVLFGYYIEDLPSPWVTIDVGRRAPDGSYLLVPLWRSIPDSTEARSFTRWQFSDQKQLELILTRFVNELLPDYAQRLWDGDAVFESVLAQQDVETEAKYQQREDRVLLLSARRSFDDGEYQASLVSYALLSDESLTAQDRRRIHLARAKMNAGELGTS